MNSEGKKAGNLANNENAETSGRKKNKAGYTAQDAPSMRSKITRDGPTDRRTDGPTD